GLRQVRWSAVVHPCVTWNYGPVTTCTAPQWRALIAYPPISWAAARSGQRPPAPGLRPLRDHGVSAHAHAGVRAEPERADADQDRDQRDADQVSPLADALTQRRAEDRLGAFGSREPAQSQRVGDDADTAHRHRRRRDHRGEQDAERRV